MKGNKKAALSVLIIILCVGVIICSGCVSKSSDKENKGTTVNNQDVQKVSFEAQYIRTNYRGNDVRESPAVTIIHSVEELSAYYEANKELYKLERKEKTDSSSSIGFLNACDRYDEEYFEERALVLVLLYAGSGSIKHEVTNFCQKNIEDEEKYVIDIRRSLPGDGTADEADWHIFIEIEKGVAIEDESQVVLEIGEVEMVNSEEYFG